MILLIILGRNSVHQKLEYPRVKGANGRNKEIALTIIYHIHQRDVFKEFLRKITANGEREKVQGTNAICGVLARLGSEHPGTLAPFSFLLD